MFANGELARYLISDMYEGNIQLFQLFTPAKSPTDPFPEFYFSDLPHFAGQIFL